MEDSLLDRQIREELELPVRARNCLSSYGVKTIGDLFLLEEKDFLLMKNLGKKTLEKIREYKKNLTEDEDDFPINDYNDNLEYNQCEDTNDSDDLVKHKEPFQKLDIEAFYNLSARAKNCLCMQGIRKIEDLLSYDKEKLLSIKNLGKKTLEELEIIIEDAKQYVECEEEKSLQNEDSILHSAWLVDCDPRYCTIFNGEKKPVFDCPIGAIPFSQLFKGIFLKKQINTFRELLEKKADDFTRIVKINSKQWDDFLSTIRSYTEITENGLKRTAIINAINDIFYIKPYKREWFRIKKLAFAFLDNNPNGEIKNFIFSDEIVEIFKEKLYGKIDHGSLVEDFVDLFPGALKAFQDDIINIMSKKGFIVINEGSIRRKYPLFRDYVLSIEDEKKKSYVVDVIHGKKYSEIATTHGITRERVRQIIHKFFSRKPMFEEDVFLALFSKYDISCDALFFILKPDEYAKYYIKKAWIRGNEPSENILNDIRIPVEMRKSYEQYLNRDVLYVDGRRIKKDFNSIIDYLIENECNDYISIDEFKKKYYSFLSANSIEITPRLEFQIATKVKISARLDVLWVQGAKFRYYDISETDFKILVNIINLEALSNIEISTKYFLDRYSSELAEFDIRDEYELHNLLRKRMDGRHDIEFLRMPNIIFGFGKRNNQVYELLQQEAPISQIELAQKYESIYGVKQTVFLASYVNDINVYLNNGVYKINYPKVTPEEQSFFSDILCESSYEISQIKEMFHSKFPDSDINKVNSFTLKKAGFFICSSIAYRYQRENFDAFFRSLFKADDVIDFSSRLWLIRTPSASNRLNVMKKEYDWFEYEPYKYISLNKLAHFIDGKKDIVSFAESVAKYSDGSPFTLKKLRKMGFSHKLDTLGFNDFFYISILRYADNLNYSRIGSQYVFVKYPETVSLESLLREIVCKEKLADVYMVIDLLKNDYGICIDKLKIAEKIANTEMYYSRTMEKIYIDYETFLGDL